MPSERFVCPHCGRSLTKSAQAYVLGEMGRGAVMGSLPPAVTCPGCGGAIDTGKMIAGDYDPPGFSAASIAPFLVAFAAFALTMGYTDGSWWLALVAAAIAFLATSFVTSRASSKKA